MTIKDLKILQSIKTRVISELPDATIYVYGSRVSGNIHEESDWDILIMTPHKINNDKKKIVHDIVHPISIKEGTFISLLFVKKDEWENSPAYYSLKLNINLRPV